jgi:UDP-N-acetylmuramate dehydrogenase
MDAVDENGVENAVSAARDRGLPLFVMGGGSNLLVSDEGFPGIVVRVSIPGIRREESESVLTAGAGEDWDSFVALCVRRNLAGIECLSGIPGRIGGTPVQNVGAYGQEVAETIVRVRVFDLSSGRFEVLDREACRFTYRASLFNTTAAGRYIILSVTYSLSAGGEPVLRYPELAREVAAGPGRPELSRVRDVVREIRRRKGMLIEPGDPDSRSAGSFFKNPIVSEEKYAELTGLAGDDLPRFPATAGSVKVPAAHLIEKAGFQRGHRRGGAAISSRHTLALTNHDQATARDIFDLAREIKNRVRDRFGVALQPEPVFLGFKEDL